MRFILRCGFEQAALSVIEFIDIAEALQIRPSHLLDELYEILKSSGQQEASIGGETKTP